MPHWLPDSTITFQLILLTSVFSACYSGPDPLTLETTDFRVQEGIREGYTADSDTSVFGLVSINGGGVGSCTGTLISPNTVITARHCVAPTLNQVNGGVDCSRTNFGSTYNASGLYVTNQTQLSRNPAHYHAVAEVLVPPVGDDFCGNDVALVTLVDPVPKTVAIPKIPRVDTKLMNGEKYYAVGYGATDDAGNGSGLRRRRDSLFIECVGDECPEFFVETSEWIGDTGICQGDSGGPAFDIFDRVIGVASRGSYGCDSPIYGDTYSWGTWLKESTLKAARSAGIAPPPWTLNWPTAPAYYHPVGDSCEESNQCDSRICIEGYCTRVCNEYSPCPEGFSCDGQCVAIPEPEPETGGCNALNGNAAGILWLLTLPALVLRRRKQP